MVFSDIADVKYIYLTTRGRRTAKLHMVELWFAIAGQKIYLSHEGEYADWMKNILQNSQVELKIGNRIFEGTARIVQDEVTFEIGKHALYRKYYGEASKDIIDDWFSESTVVEITM